MSDKHHINDALLPLPEDPRDVSHTMLFGAAELDALPDGDFFAGEILKVKDQNYQVPNSDFCAGYAGAAVKEDQEMEELNPEYTWVQAKKAKGADEWQKWGLNLRDLCLAGKNKGFLEQQYYPFENRTELTREFIANPANWPEDLDMLAFEHRAASFAAVDGPHDTFDNYRSTMWMRRKEHRSILTGLKWRRSFMDSPRGIIEDRDYSDEAGFGHAIKVLGQINMENPYTKKKELYAIAQLSSGKDVGDDGIFYLPRGVVNRECVFGAFTFLDVTAEQAKYHQEIGVRLDANPFYKLLQVLLNAFFGKTV